MWPINKRVVLLSKKLLKLVSKNLVNINDEIAVNYCFSKRLT